MWRLPIPEQIREAVRTESKIADILQHNWVRWGSALYAAAFLEQFVEGRAVGPPRHRRRGLEHRVALGACPVRGDRLRGHHAGGARPPAGRPGQERRRGGSGLSAALFGNVGRIFCFCRRFQSRIRCGTPTSAASYDGTPLRLAKSWAHCTEGTRRLVHSPSWATSRSVTSVKVVRGSTKPSTPRRLWMKSRGASRRRRRRCAARPRPPPRRPRRNRSASPCTQCAVSAVAAPRLAPGSLPPARVVGWLDVPERDQQFDLVVLGAGSGGYACALRAAQLGLSVARREGQGRRHLPPRRVHPDQGAAARRRGGRLHPRVGEVRGPDHLQGIDIPAVNAYKDGVVAQLFKGLTGSSRAAASP